MPEERLLSISSSSHLSPDDVARHSFGTVRRGFDPDEVRAYLESLAAALKGIDERQRQLLDELSGAEERARNPVLDEPTLTSALGKETARVLHSAHEVAAEMTAKAEAESEALLTTARQEIQEVKEKTEARLAEQSTASEVAANQLRDRTNQQVADRLEVARRESEELVALAREECRQMVDEAQRLRARVLADLSKRRKVLHAQIEQLRAGRERLAETVNDVRRSIDVIADDLFAAEDNARLAAETAGREALGRTDDTTPEELAALLLANEAEVAGEEPTADRADSELVVVEIDVVEEPPAPADGDDDQVAAEADAEAEAEAGAVIDVLVPDPAADAASDAEDSQVDALFAKIRAAREEPGDSSGTDDPEEEAAEGAVADAVEGEPVEEAVVGSTADDQGFRDVEAEEEDADPPEARSPATVRRDEMIDPIVVSLSRRLKRTLQDEQNELLDSLRSKGTQWSIDLLPELTEHLDAVSTAAIPALEQASEAGVAFADTKSHTGPQADTLLEIAHDLAEAVVGPLRRRLADGEGLEEADESAVAEHVGSAFREWKGERIERLAGDHVVAAFSAGTIAAAAGSPPDQIEWVAVSASGDDPCPDCEDNGLNGSQLPGEAFPTGHRHPPVHPGCRCLLAPAST